MRNKIDFIIYIIYNKMETENALTYHKTWIKNNPNYHKEYREKNKEKISAYMKQYVIDNAARLKQYHKEYMIQWYAKNRKEKEPKVKPIKQPKEESVKQNVLPSSEPIEILSSQKKKGYNKKYYQIWSQKKREKELQEKVAKFKASLGFVNT